MECRRRTLRRSLFLGVCLIGCRSTTALLSTPILRPGSGAHGNRAWKLGRATEKKVVLFSRRRAGGSGFGYGSGGGYGYGGRGSSQNSPLRRPVSDSDSAPSLTLTQMLIIANVLAFLAQLASAYTAHDRISALFKAAGQRAPTAQERGLPFSLPQYSLGFNSRVISGQGSFTRDFIMDPRYVRSRRFGLQTFRCITSAFLHGSLFHLGMNMWNLNRVGHMIEGLGLKNGGARGGSGGRQQSSAKGMLLLGGTYLLSAVAGSYLRSPLT